MEELVKYIQTLLEWYFNSIKFLSSGFVKLDKAQIKQSKTRGREL